MYINDGNIVSTKIKTTILFPQLKFKGWDNNISPLQVIKDKNVSIENYNQILQADLRYPIILDSNLKIIDGAHRLSKAYILNKKYIRAYIFDKDIMNKFKIREKKENCKWMKTDLNYYESLTVKDVEELYNKRFNYK